MNNLLRHKEKILLVFILLFAAFLRLYRIADYMTFLGDEGRDVLVVYDILHGKLTLLGPTASVGGFFLGPIYYYFMAPFLWLFNYNPVGPAVMVGLFGTATVWLVYKVGNEFFNKTTGLIASFLYAISPLIIAYSRSSWNPNLMPFFSLLSLYILYRAIHKGSSMLLLFCGFLLGIAMQLHYLTIFLGIIVALYILLIDIFSEYYKRNKLQAKKLVPQIIKKYIVLFFGFLIGLSQFLAFELRHGFPNIHSIVTFIFYSGQTGSNGEFFGILGNVFIRLFGRLLTKFPPPEQVSLQAHTDITIWYYVTLTLALVSTAIFLLQWFESLKQRSQNFLKYNLLFLWFFVGIFLFGFYKKPIYDYYFGFMFALPFLLTGNACSFLWKQNNMLKAVAAICFVWLTWINLTGIPFRFPPNRQLAQVKEISQFVLDKTEAKPFNFALITGGNSDHGYRYFLMLVKRPPVQIETLTKDPKRTTVTQQLLVVCESSTCQPLGNPIWEIAGFGRAEIVEEWNISVVKVYKLVHYKEPLRNQK